MHSFLQFSYLQWLVLAGGYLATFVLSGWVVRWILGPFPDPPGDSQELRNGPTRKETDLGAIIGKCENFLSVTFIIADQVTGLALIFAAKSILRAEDMKNNPRFFLGGTLVNLCFSVLMGIIIYRCLALVGAP